jgi:hypothetical protein
VGKAARIVLVAIALSMAPTSTYARLPAPPFDLQISPARVSEGGSATIQIAPATRSSATGARHDIYVLWAQAEEAAFLTPQGAWAPAPVALSRDTTVKDAPTLRVTWNGARPVMDIPLALLVVPTGTDPLDRAGWTYRPVIRWLSVRGPSTPWSLESGALLFALAAVAGSLVIAFADIRVPARKGGATSIRK